MVEEGQTAPDFTLPDQDGNQVSLSGLRGQKVILYFYPKADTPGCTKQSRSLRDASGDIEKLGAVVLGVSPDPPDRQKKFDQKYSLGFPLLSDPDHRVAEAYGAWGKKSSFGKKYEGIIRSAFAIDEQGKVTGAFHKVSPKDTVPETLAALGA